mmetsp:Transcript_15625/g.38715  ORF Transcript_15625/g.38715 Transcript_15625/m.38715 type:complete len:263 (+) Transcript_15625:853-1641(+)
MRSTSSRDDEVPLLDVGRKAVWSPSTSAAAPPSSSVASATVLFIELCASCAPASDGSSKSKQGFASIVPFSPMTNDDSHAAARALSFSSFSIRSILSFSFASTSACFSSRRRSFSAAAFSLCRTSSSLKYFSLFRSTPACSRTHATKRSAASFFPPLTSRSSTFRWYESSSNRLRANRRDCSSAKTSPSSARTSPFSYKSSAFASARFAKTSDQYLAASYTNRARSTNGTTYARCSSRCRYVSTASTYSYWKRSHDRCSRWM